MTRELHRTRANDSPRGSRPSLRANIRDVLARILARGSSAPRLACVVGA
jgi:hypothetical protein